MKNLQLFSFKENRLVFQNGGPEKAGRVEAKEVLFKPSKLYEEFTGYLGEGNNKMMRSIERCTTGSCFARNISKWLKKVYLPRIKSLGFKGRVKRNELKKYVRGVWRKLRPKLRNRGKDFISDVEDANKEWIKLVEVVNRKFSNTAATKIASIVKNYAPYVQKTTIGGGSADTTNRPNLNNVRKGVKALLATLGRKYKIKFEHYSIKNNGEPKVKANLKNIVTSNTKINNLKIKKVNKEFASLVASKYPKA